MKGSGAWSERASRLFCILVLLGGVFLIIEFAMIPVLTVFIAFFTAELIAPFSKRISKATGLPFRAVSGVIVILLLLLITAILFLLLSRLFAECKDMVLYLSLNEDKISGLWIYYTSFLEKLPFGGEYFEQISKTAVKDIVSSLGSQIGTFLGSIVEGSTQTITWLVFVIASCIYVSIDRERIYGFVRALLPGGITDKLRALRKGALDIAKSYIRAYIIIFILTFSEVFIGLSILKAPYALVLALAVAAVDILPVLGSGAILIPWALFSFLTRDGSFGVGLLVLYGIITIIRQIAEPKIIGNKMGIHPLAVIGALTLATWLFGAKGVIVAPICLIFIKALYNGKPKKM